MKTSFMFEHNNDYGQLIEERNISGTFYSLQLWRLEDNSYKFRCKPLEGINFIDLLGQTKTNKKTHMYFATDNMVLVNTSDQYIRVFDRFGYIIQPENSEFQLEK